MCICLRNSTHIIISLCTPHIKHARTHTHTVQSTINQPTQIAGPQAEHHISDNKIRATYMVKHKLHARYMITMPTNMKANRMPTKHGVPILFRKRCDFQGHQRPGLFLASPWAMKASTSSRLTTSGIFRVWISYGMNAGVGSWLFRLLQRNLSSCLFKW